MSVNQKHIDATFDFASSRESFTVEELAEHLNLSVAQAASAIRETRDMLADLDVNIVPTPNGHRERWLYRLVSRHADQSEWQENRMSDAERRLKTLKAVAQSIVNAEDGRTKQGRKAAKFAKFLGRLVEDIEEIEAEFAL